MGEEKADEVTEEWEQIKPLFDEDYWKACILLSKKNVPGKCPMCSSEFWAITADGQYTFGISPVRRPYEEKKELKTLVFTCDNCGFMAQHSVDFLLSRQNHKDGGK